VLEIPCELIRFSKNAPDFSGEFIVARRVKSFGAHKRRRTFRVNELGSLKVA
jgi:hypothetical protein